MAKFNGPFEPLNDYNDEEMESYDFCKLETLGGGELSYVFGPAHGMYEFSSQQYSANCIYSGPNYVLELVVIRNTVGESLSSSEPSNLDYRSGIGAYYNKNPYEIPVEITRPTNYSTYVNYGSKRSIYSNVRWDGQYWRFTVNTYRSDWYFVRFENGVPDDICPPGTVFNPDTGTCDILPGWGWDPNGGSDGGGGYVLITPGMPIGEPEVPGELPPYYTGDPTTEVKPECYTWNEELALWEFDDTLPGCSEGSDCIRSAICIVEPSLDLIPDDIDSILPPGYVDEGSLPGINQPTDSITAGCVKDDSIIECDTEDDVTTKTGCSIIPEC